MGSSPQLEAVEEEKGMRVKIKTNEGETLTTISCTPAPDDLVKALHMANTLKERWLSNAPQYFANTNLCVVIEEK
jgi:hypothetical protein